MAFYIVSIVGGNIFLILLSIFSGMEKFGYSILYSILAPMIGTVAVIALDGLFAWLIRRLPEKWFCWDTRFSNTPKWERKFYEFLGIKKWKDHILELGMFTSFSKKKIADPNSVEYMERFILESNYGYVIHLENAIVGFAMIFFYPLEYMWYFGMEIAIVNAFLSLAPMAILRYNTPRLVRRRQILVEKSLKKNSTNA